MGPDFDPSWMSARRPSEALLSGKTVELGENQLAELVAQVAALDLDRELKELDGEAPDEDNFIEQVGDSIKMIFIFLLPSPDSSYEHLEDFLTIDDSLHAGF